MALRDPIAAYNAANNVEAHLVCNALIESGIEAQVIEDVSAVGVWMFGLLPEIHKPQVWIEREDIERAKTVLDDYEQRASDRREPAATGETIEAACEECGARSTFPSTQRGSVQKCPQCQAFVDVGDDAAIEGWDAPAEDQPEG